VIIPALPARPLGRSQLSFAWSPRGATLAVYDDADIFLARPDGRVKRVARGCFGAWSPEGTRFAYTSRRKLYVATVNGRARAVARADYVDDWGAGDRLLIVRVGPKLAECRGLQTSRISLLLLLDRREIRVTGDAVVEEGRTYRRSEQGPASFSANGRLIAFAEKPPCGYTGRDYVRRAFVATLAPRSVRRVGYGRPSWLPRRSRLLLTEARPGSFEIVEEQGRRYEFRGDYASTSIAPSRDGSRIVFGVQPDYRLPENLYIAPVNRPDAARLLARRATAPLWLIEDRRVAFLGHTAQFCYALHVVRPDGRLRRRILPCF
jgi:hypothetical protein